MSRIINGHEYFCSEEIERSFTRWRDARIEKLEAEVERLRADAERRLRDWNWEMGRRCDVEREVLRLKEYLSEAREQAEQFKQQWVLCRAEVERLRKGIAAVSSLIADSSGVYGLHLNGDPAPWDELLSGGRFEEWLADFDAARGES